MSIIKIICGNISLNFELYDASRLKCPILPVRFSLSVFTRFWRAGRAANCAVANPPASRSSSSRRPSVLPAVSSPVPPFTILFHFSYLPVRFSRDFGERRTAPSHSRGRYFSDLSPSSLCKNKNRELLGAALYRKYVFLSISCVSPFTSVALLLFGRHFSRQQVLNY